MNDRVPCKHNPGTGCEDTTKCGACGWNPEVARRRIRAQKEADAIKRKKGTQREPSKAGRAGRGGARERAETSPQAGAELSGLCDDDMTYFQKITASQEALAAFLSSLNVADGPWDFLFHQTFCTKCRASNCNVCPHEAERGNPAWFLKQKVVDDGKGPLR